MRICQYRKLFRIKMRFILIAKPINLIDHMINFHKQPVVEERLKKKIWGKRRHTCTARIHHWKARNKKKSLPKINYVSKIPRSCFLSALKQFFVLWHLCYFYIPYSTHCAFSELIQSSLFIFTDGLFYLFTFRYVFFFAFFYSTFNFSFM